MAVRAAVPLAHPFDDGSAAVLSRRSPTSRRSLGADADAWVDLMAPFVERATSFFADILRPVRIPRHPLLMARFGLAGPASLRSRCSARSAAPQRGAVRGQCRPLVPAARSRRIRVLRRRAGCRRRTRRLAVRARRLAADRRRARRACAIARLRRSGRRRPVRSLADLPPARAVLFDVTPRQLLRDCRRRALRVATAASCSASATGPASFKVDYALSRPIPGRAASAAGGRTVHVGGTAEEVARSEAAVERWTRSPTRRSCWSRSRASFDDSRAPAGLQTGWAYCHVPHGSDVDMTDRSSGRSNASRRGSATSSWPGTSFAGGAAKPTIPT